VIDRLAKQGNPNAIPLARPMPRKDSLDFSFSGIKTNVARWVEKHGRPGDDQALRDLCATFQRRVVDVLVQKTLRAAMDEQVRTVVLAGGVAANRELRESTKAAGERLGLRVVVPPLAACTDNAAMIAFAGAVRLEHGEDDRGRIDTSPHTALFSVTRKGSGRRAVSSGARS
jgi:N6-L-threonylcarbamoyladenine synthase